MRATPVNLIGGFYADDTRPWSVQDTVNWLPVAAEVDGTLTPTKLSTPPGLKPYQKIGTGPIRGMYNCEGQMLVVSGRTMYRISNAGVGIPVGTIPGVGRVSISHNQFKGGNQVLVTNGSPGGGYVYDTQTQQFNRISDPGFPGSLMTAYVDSYLLGVEPQGRFWFHSNLADANDYNTLDRYEAEAAPDRIVGLAVSQFEVWTFGERTTECFGNTGGATGTFQSRRTSIERGCASRWTIQNLDNSVFWLGDDGIVYRLEGYGARRVSTVPLERAIAANRLRDAFAFTWEDKGHKVYYLTMPDGNTWGYDVVSGVWHRRESYGLARWRLNDAVRWNGSWYGGDFQNGRIWRLDWDYPAEGDQPMVSERTSPVMADNQSAFIASSVELIMGTGQQPVAISGRFPEQPPMPVISGNAPDGVESELWGPYTYTASNGTPPYIFTIASGSPPEGFTLAQDGTFPAAMADARGRYNFDVKAIDANGLPAQLSDSITISPPPVLALGMDSSDGTSLRLSSSVNGLDWVAPYGSAATNYSKISALPGYRVMATSGGSTSAVISDDKGVTWATVTFPASAHNYGISAISGGSTVICTTSGFARSTDSGVTWVQVGPAGVATVTVAASEALMVGLTDETRPTISADDGATWSAPADRLDVSLIPSFAFQYCCAYGGGWFVFGGATTDARPAVAITKDGISFSSVQLDSTSRNVVSVCHGNVASGQDVWLAGCSDGAMYIATGKPDAWTAIPFSLGVNVADIVFTGERFIAGGGSGGSTAVASSVDGSTWALGSIGLGEEIRGFAQVRK